MAFKPSSDGLHPFKASTTHSIGLQPDLKRTTKTVGLIGQEMAVAAGRVWVSNRWVDLSGSPRELRGDWRRLEGSLGDELFDHNNISWGKGKICTIGFSVCSCFWVCPVVVQI